jgi:transposase-like protein
MQIASTVLGIKICSPFIFKLARNLFLFVEWIDWNEWLIPLLPDKIALESNLFSLQQDNQYNLFPQKEILSQWVKDNDSKRNDISFIIKNIQKQWR